MQFEPLAKGYAHMWETMAIRPEYKAVSEAISERLFSHKKRYDIVAAATGVPWWFIAIIHEMESGGNFGAHLHNGDTLARRTIHVPSGRPIKGQPPFSWEASAADALEMKGITDKPASFWTIPRALYEFERYNGFGYFGKINSPYVWSFSTHYDKGKITRDHGPIEPVKSKQCGAACLLYSLAKAGHLGKVTTMQDLTNLLKAFERVAPTLVTAMGGPVAGMAVTMLARAIGSGSEPEDIIKAINQDPAAAISAIAKVNADLTPLVGAPDQPPAIATTPATNEGPMTGIDAILGGELFKGKKTIIGVVAMVGLSVAYNLNLVSHDLLTPDLYNTALTALQGLVGLSIYSAIQRGKSSILGWK